MLLSQVTYQTQYYYRKHSLQLFLLNSPHRSTIARPTNFTYKYHSGSQQRTIRLFGHSCLFITTHRWELLGFPNNFYRITFIFQKISAPIMLSMFFTYMYFTLRRSLTIGFNCTQCILHENCFTMLWKTIKIVPTLQ